MPTTHSIRTRTTVGFVTGLLVALVAAAVIAGASPSTAQSPGIDIEGDRYTLPGPDGSPLLDDCGRPVRVTAAEIFAAADDPPVRSGTVIEIATDSRARAAQRFALDSVIDRLGLDSIDDLSVLTDAAHPANARAERLFRVFLARQYRSRGVDLRVTPRAAATAVFAPLPPG